MRQSPVCANANQQQLAQCQHHALRRRRAADAKASKLSQAQNDPAATKQAASAVQQGQYIAADAAMYKEMREALADFDSNLNIETNTASNNSRSPREKPAARHKAFYAALKSVLGQVLDEATEDARHTRLLAAHQWYVKHKPRPKPRDMDMAAAMAASLSVTCPVTDESSDTAMTAADDDAIGSESVNSATDRAAAAGSSYRSSHSSSRTHQQQHQQQFVLYGMPRQSPQGGKVFQQPQPDASDVAIGLANSSRTNRWQQQQQRLHNDDTYPITSDIKDHTATTASGSITIAAAATPTRIFPEQPSMREMPAIQSCGEHRAALFDGGRRSADATGRGPLSWAGSAAGIAAGSAPNTDGLIPLGSLPSRRYLPNQGNSSRGSSSGGADSSSYAGVHPQAGRLGSSSSSALGESLIGSDGYAAGKAQWAAVAAAQQRIETAVSSEMQGYNRHRARLEEEISRKQEVAAVMSLEINRNNKINDRNNSGSNRNSTGTRALVHLDSQHQPSEVSAYQWSKGVVQQLVPVNRVKEAKKQLMQESAREVAEVADQLRDLGLTADPAVLEHALMPVPDQAYMVCLAHLPKPGLAPGQSHATRLHSGAKKSKKKAKQTKKSPTNR